MDPIRTWLVMGIWEKSCFFFLFTVSAITLVRALRLAWWLKRTSVGASPEAGGTTALRAWHRSNFARSISGFAQAAFWFTCAGAAAGLLRAGTVVGESTRSPLAIIAEDSVSVLEATGMGLALCTLLFVAAWAFDASAWHFTGSSRVLSAIVRLRRLLWPIAILLLAATLFEIRPTFTAVAVSGDRRVGYAIFTALGQLLSRLWLLFAAMGALTWLIVLIEGAAMRRLRPA